MIPAVLRHEPQFRLLFLGQAWSMLGDRITFIALPFAVLAIGGSAAEVGLVVAAGSFEGVLGLHELLAIQTVVGVPIALAVLAVPAVREIRRRVPEPEAAPAVETV